MVIYQCDKCELLLKPGETKIYHLSETSDEVGVGVIDMDLCEECIKPLFEKETNGLCVRCPQCEKGISYMGGYCNGDTKIKCTYCGKTFILGEQK